MVELNQRERAIKIKIVYYGPPLGGKTTNLRLVHQGARWDRRGELTSVNSSQDRTILFDFLPVRVPGFRGFDVRLQLVAVPGQVLYATTRKIALKNTDAVVFVANSALDRFTENVQSYNEMYQYLSAHGIDPNEVPMVMQYNKRDLPQVLEIEHLEHALNPRKVPHLPAVASRGEGVLETLAAVLAETIGQLAKRYRSLELGAGQTPQAWVADTIQEVFGKPSLQFKAVSADDMQFEPHIVPSGYDTLGGPEFLKVAEDRRTLRIAIAEDFPRPPLNAAQHTRLHEALTESYAEASSELASVAAGLREERDLARARFAGVRKLLDASDQITSGMDVLAGLHEALARLGTAAGTSFASLVLSPTGIDYRAFPRPPLAEEPLLRAPHGAAMLESLRWEESALLVRAADRPELAHALAGSAPGFAAFAIVPLRRPQRLLGFALLYYTPDAALPGEAALEHLSLLARILCAPLELAIGRGVI